MSNINLAWASGLFEGEGCISITKTKTQKEIYEYLNLSMNMTDKDSVFQFRDIVKHGTVVAFNPPSNRNNGYKPAWIWRTTGNQAKETAWLLAPYLGTRRRTRLMSILLKEDYLDPIITKPEEGWIPKTFTKDMLIPWASGLFEGEGCFTTVRNRLSLQIAMTDEDIMKVFHEIAGFGSLCMPAKQQANHKQQWRWSGRGDLAKAFAWKLAPYLSQRRRLRFAEILALETDVTDD